MPINTAYIQEFIGNQWARKNKKVTKYEGGFLPPEHVYKQFFEIFVRNETHSDEESESYWNRVHRRSNYRYYNLLGF